VKPLAISKLIWGGMESSWRFTTASRKQEIERALKARGWFPQAATKPAGHTINAGAFRVNYQGARSFGSQTNAS
jgi:hypothetical protein